jgi:hypothetical protein
MPNGYRATSEYSRRYPRRTSCKDHAIRSRYAASPVRCPASGKGETEAAAQCRIRRLPRWRFALFFNTLIKACSSTIGPGDALINRAVGFILSNSAALPGRAYGCSTPNGSSGWPPARTVGPWKRSSVNVSSHTVGQATALAEDAMFAHSLVQQCLAKTVVDLVGAGVQQVFPF